jgi:hypothetical protein
MYTQRVCSGNHRVDMRSGQDLAIVCGNIENFFHVTFNMSGVSIRIFIGKLVT